MPNPRMLTEIAGRVRRARGELLANNHPYSDEIYEAAVLLRMATDAILTVANRPRIEKF